MQQIFSISLIIDNVNCGLFSDMKGWKCVIIIFLLIFLLSFSNPAIIINMEPMVWSQPSSICRQQEAWIFQFEDVSRALLTVYNNSTPFIHPIFRYRIQTTFKDFNLTSFNWDYLTVPNHRIGLMGNLILPHMKTTSTLDMKVGYVYK